MLKKIFIIIINISIIFSLAYGENNVKYDEPISKIHETYGLDNLTEMTDEEKEEIKEKYDEKIDYIKGVAYKNTDEFYEKNIIQNNIIKYLNGKYSKQKEPVYNDIIEELGKNFNELIPLYPDDKMSNGEIEIIVLDYKSGRTVKIMDNQTDEFYKDLYFIKMIWAQRHDKDYLDTAKEVYKKIRGHTKEWNGFFENVRKPQYPWEEWLNSWGTSKFYKPEEYVRKSPNKLQVTFAHLTPTFEYSFDESATITPALGIQWLGLRKFSGETFEKNMGISYIMTLNSNIEDDKPGHGLMVNYNKYDVGVIYRESSKVDVKWWLVFGINIAGITKDTKYYPSTFKELIDSKE